MPSYSSSRIAVFPGKGVPPLHGFGLIKTANPDDEGYQLPPASAGGSGSLSSVLGLQPQKSRLKPAEIPMGFALPSLKRGATDVFRARNTNSGRLAMPFAEAEVADFCLLLPPPVSLSGSPSTAEIG